MTFIIPEADFLLLQNLAGRIIYVIVTATIQSQYEILRIDPSIQIRFVSQRLQIEKLGLNAQVYYCSEEEL